jgi:hypothetical protein
MNLYSLPRRRAATAASDNSTAARPIPSSNVELIQSAQVAQTLPKWNETARDFVYMLRELLRADVCAD